MSRSDSRQLATKVKRNQWLRCAIAMTLAGVCGCSSIPGQRRLGLPVTASQLPAASNSPVDAISRRADQFPAPTSHRLTDNGKTAISPTAEQIALVSYEQTEDIANPAARPSTQATPRASAIATLASCTVSGNCATGSCAPTSSCGCGQTSCGCQSSGIQSTDVQEYLFDGGDQDPRLVLRRDGSVVGLDPTDTVAYYQTYDGKNCITPTNRVPIYAPRFGAVRKISGAILADHAVATERILAPTKPVGFIESNPTLTAMLPVGPRGNERVSLIDALEDRNLGIPLEKVLPPQRMSNALVPFQNVEFLATGLLTDAELPLLRELWNNAKSWDTTESIEILINDQPAVVQQDVKLAKEIHVYDVPPGKCSLRICKAASHSLADSGDTISFSIRFDNIGATPIEKVVILDNLSPRLEYIEGSQQSSVSPEPEFSAEPNDVGSMTLRWEVKPAIKPGEGGVIHFRCLVR